MRCAPLLAGVLLVCACQTPEPVPYEPDRRDYANFAVGWKGLYEPNYLPFMVHREELSDDPRGDLKRRK